jgi:putative solute:sodium symporter small subunit
MPDTNSVEADPKGYWKANLRLMSILLVAWAFVSFGLGIFFVEPLNQAQMGGFPLGFWFAHQGSIYTFIVLIWVYAVASDRLARRFGVD